MTQRRSAIRAALPWATEFGHEVEATVAARLREAVAANDEKRVLELRSILDGLAELDAIPESVTLRSGTGADDAATLVARLSPGQADCVRLVAEHLKTGQIATRLGISDHAVDGRLKQACRTLGVTNRADAARLWLLANPQKTAVRQSPDIADQSPEMPAATTAGNVLLPDEQADRATPHVLRDVAFPAPSSADWRVELSLKGARDNELTWPWRLGVIVLTSIFGPLILFLIASLLGAALRGAHQLVAIIANLFR